MELFFLCCFAFGAVFTLLSVFLSVAGIAGHGMHGAHGLHGAHAAHLPAHTGGDVHTAGHHGHLPATVHHAAHATADIAHVAEHGFLQTLLPVLNASSLLAFLTWFGAAGYLLMYIGMPSLLALPIAVVTGIAPALLLGWFLVKVAAGEREMDPVNYDLVGTGCRVTMSIPAGGVGEIVFSKAGARRSEAARSANGTDIPRNTEVVITRYNHGIAEVMSIEELMRSSDPFFPDSITPSLGDPAGEPGS